MITLLAATALAGCLGSGSGGGGATGGGGGGGGDDDKTKTAFDAAFEKTTGVMTSTSPLKGKANYVGQVEVLTDANPNDKFEAVYGDLKMQVDFGAAKRPVSGTIGNFAGKVEGEAVKIKGTLDTANAKDSLPNMISKNTFNVPAPGSGTVTQTGLTATFQGALEDPESKLSGEAQMTLQGNFFGANGEGVAGSAGAIIKPTTGPQMIRGGRFYADKK